MPIHLVNASRRESPAVIVVSLIRDKSSLVGQRIDQQRSFQLQRDRIIWIRPRALDNWKNVELLDVNQLTANSVVIPFEGQPPIPLALAAVEVFHAALGPVMVYVDR